MNELQFLLTLYAIACLLFVVTGVIMIGIILKQRKNIIDFIKENRRW